MNITCPYLMTHWDSISRNLYTRSFFSDWTYWTAERWRQILGCFGPFADLPSKLVLLEANFRMQLDPSYMQPSHRGRCLFKATCWSFCRSQQVARDGCGYLLTLICTKVPPKRTLKQQTHQSITQLAYPKGYLCRHQILLRIISLLTHSSSYTMVRINPHNQLEGQLHPQTGQ